jgi:hypothetical protein
MIVVLIEIEIIVVKLSCVLVKHMHADATIYVMSIRVFVCECYKIVKGESNKSFKNTSMLRVLEKDWLAGF